MARSEISINTREAKSSDVEACIDIRGKTRENPVPVEVLNSFGVSYESWTLSIEKGAIYGAVAEVSQHVVAFCFGDKNSAEVLVLAMLPEYENRGIGKLLLSQVATQLFELGHVRLWLAASPDPKIRAHGFYRHLGWQDTGEKDNHGDQILELNRADFSF